MKLRNLYLLLLLFAAIACKGETENDSEETSIEIESSDSVEVQEVLDDLLVATEEIIEESDCSGSLEVYLNDPDKENPTNIRNSPGGEVVMQLAAGEYWMTVVETDNGWFKIKGLKIEGPDEIVDIPAEEAWIHGSVISVDTRNYGGEVIELHEKATTKSEIVGNFNGEQYGLHLSDMCGDWIEVEWNFGGTIKTGWLEAGWLCGNPLTTCS